MAYRYYKKTVVSCHSYSKEPDSEAPKFGDDWILPQPNRKIRPNGAAVLSISEDKCVKICVEQTMAAFYAQQRKTVKDVK